MTNLPFLNYTHHQVTKEDAEAVIRVLGSGAPLAQGPEVDAFETELCAHTGAPYAVVVNSGTAALHLAYALCYQAGQRISMPAISFVATGNAALYCGLRIEWKDVSPRTGLVLGDSDVGVELGGQPTGHRHTIVDACHSLRYVENALITVLSFHPAKHVVCGEGGAILTSNQTIADNARLLRSHGRVGTKMEGLGFNYRMPEMNAALGRSQLKRVTANIAKRVALAERYDALLADVTEVLPVPHKGETHRHLYQVRVKDRDMVQGKLKDRGIGTAIQYPVIPDQPYYRRKYGEAEGLGWAREFASEVLALPLFPQMTDADVARVVDALKESL